MFIRSFGAASLLIAFCVTFAQAEKPLTAAKTMFKKSTHVVTGIAKEIYQHKVQKGNYEETHYVAEIQVDGVEKGDGIKVGQLIYVRYWGRRWTAAGNPEPGTNGHSPLAKKQQAYRVHLAKDAYDGFGTEKNDGGYNVWGVNGFVPLKKKVESKQ